MEFCKVNCVDITNIQSRYDAYNEYFYHLKKKKEE